MFVQLMVIFLLMPPLLEALSWDGWIRVGTCRVSCVKTFLGWPPMDDACHAQVNCSQCWDLCELLQTDEQWRHLCRPTAAHLCVPGCKEACQFPADRISKAGSKRWNFTRPVNITRDEEHGYLRAEWNPPRQQSDVINDQTTSEKEYPYLVYSIIEEVGDSAHWTVLYMGVNTTADIVTLGGSNGDTEQHGRFRLMAFHESGLAAELTIPAYAHGPEDYADYTQSDQNGDLPANDMSTHNAVQRSPASHYYHADPRQPVDIDAYDDFDVGTDAPSFNISVLVETTRQGALKLHVTWTLPEDDVASPMSSGEDGVALCIVNWARYTCNIDRTYPHCDVPSDHFDIIRKGRRGQEVDTVLPGITFNSHYWVSVEVAGIESRRVDFITPGCSSPAAAFTRCLHTGPPWSANITCVDPELGNRGSLRMRLQWSAPQLANGRSPIAYRVTYLGMTPDGDANNNVVSVDTKKTTNTSVSLQLSVNAVYEITVTAEIGSNSDTMNFRSAILRVKTSRLMQSAGKDIPICNLSSRQPTVRTRDRGNKAVTLVLIIMCSLLGVAMVTCISLLICRKWRHLQANIITHKVMVAKNNIYNSVPERSDEFSGVEQQLLLVGDEWELDPREIQLGSELGHGAFGKVYTGFYRDTKVAIKVMKEEMPVACKDDLLCEIALMKQVGSHPNIVSLLGACTLCRPIALIMEFMPFGNLERFLQKCKLEGELQKKDDDIYSVTYAMVNDFGDTEQWTVTSKDMLSFARQVAQAMEYLSARECVHRDLAARNVLIGHGKVVKLCDFGLARVMGSEGGYQKRSSGKLPLKWLALETLRGYVHTTYSDVWSYGVLLWEIVTMGACPYSDIALADLYTVLSNGYRMEQPRNCSDELYDVISQCWYENPKDRPTFTQLRMRIEGLLARHENYLELCNIGSAAADACHVITTT